MPETLHNKYSDMLQQLLFTIYGDLLSRYDDVDAVKKEIYNIGIEALKEFGAKDPLGDKIENLLFVMQNSQNEKEKQNAKEKLVVLNNALKIITEKEDESNE